MDRSKRRRVAVPTPSSRVLTPLSRAPRGSSQSSTAPLAPAVGSATARDPRQSLIFPLCIWEIVASFNVLSSHAHLILLASIFTSLRASLDRRRGDVRTQLDRGPRAFLGRYDISFPCVLDHRRLFMMRYKRQSHAFRDGEDEADDEDEDECEEFGPHLVVLNSHTGNVIVDFGVAEDTDRKFNLLSSMCTLDSDTILYLHYRSLTHLDISYPPVKEKQLTTRFPVATWRPRIALSTQLESRPGWIMNDDIRIQTAVDSKRRVVVPWWGTNQVAIHNVITGKIEGVLTSRWVSNDAQSSWVATTQQGYLVSYQRNPDLEMRSRGEKQRQLLGGTVRSNGTREASSAASREGRTSLTISSSAYPQGPCVLLYNSDREAIRFWDFAGAIPYGVASANFKLSRPTGRTTERVYVLLPGPTLSVIEYFDEHPAASVPTANHISVPGASMCASVVGQVIASCEVGHPKTQPDHLLLTRPGNIFVALCAHRQPCGLLAFPLV